MKDVCRSAATHYTTIAVRSSAHIENSVVFRRIRAVRTRKTERK